MAERRYNDKEIAAIFRAAAEEGPQSPQREVARNVNLNRRLTDEEWERLVVQLREVFNARGRTRSDGSLRQWTNGNLQVLLEPTATGHRLRFGTTHGAARGAIGVGFAFLGVTAIVAVSGLIWGTLGDAASGIALMAAAGVG